MNILLIGPRAAGKTTIGRLFAERCNRAFVDLDDHVRARFGGRGVREIWATHGETAWRQAEVSCLVEVLWQSDHVIALGGGTPMIPEAQKTIVAAQHSDRARVVYLQCEVTELVRRLRESAGDRPSLTGENVAIETSRVLVEREPAYLKLADATVRTDSSNRDDVVARLLEIDRE
jgi:shikimate kinase